MKGFKKVRQLFYDEARKRFLHTVNAPLKDTKWIVGVRRAHSKLIATAIYYDGAYQGSKYWKIDIFSRKRDKAYLDWLTGYICEKEWQWHDPYLE